MLLAAPCPAAAAAGQGAARSMGLACLLSGRAITVSDSCTTCNRCKHRMLTSLLRSRVSKKQRGEPGGASDALPLSGRTAAGGVSVPCPLCHYLMENVKLSGDAAAAAAAGPSAAGLDASGVGGGRRRSEASMRRGLAASGSFH